MARNRDRQFSEGESLSAADLGAYSPEEVERLPAWARDMEDAPEKPARENHSGSVDASEETEARGEETLSQEVATAPEAEEAAAENRAETAEPTEDETRVRREEAREAWNQEAIRVEGGQYRRNRPLPENGGDARKKNGKSKGKGKKRKKKNASEAEEKRNFLKTMAIVGVCSVLFLMLALMVVSNFISHPLLALPRRLVTAVVEPVQSVFSRLTDSVANYLRTLKIRGNLEYEYEQLLIKLDDMANETAVNEELRHENEELRSMLFEQGQESHQAMNPLGAQVIGKVGNNYFSTLTLNVGSQDGVTEYMAVVSDGGLVGVTYNVQEHKCDVRCIIDSDCTVAGLVQSSRDQGSVKGALGTTGEPMCRMYYLPDNSLPRPGDVVVTSGVGLEFPKGIPIGYIRESTRGMEDNKSYVVLEPRVDFQHLEYVTVYRYRPSYAENAQSRTSSTQNMALEPLVTARPVPSFEMEGLSDFIYTSTAAPENQAAGESTVEPEDVSDTPVPTGTVDPNATPVPPNLEYVAVDNNGGTPSPSPRPTITPTPSPAPTPDPGAMTVEDDE